MPSIRVRSNSVAYSSLDGTQTRQLSHIFGHNAAPPLKTHTSDLHPATNVPSPGSEYPRSENPPRRGTSRVHKHLLPGRRSEERGTESTQILSQPRSMSPQALTTVHGSQIDIQMNANDEPGHIGSALSIHSAGTERRTDLHHDTIVEHLDCIDPQVSALTNLTNATNAILIPPISFYSRKPTLVLPSRSKASRAGGDSGEKGGSGDQYEDSLDRHVEDVLESPSKWKRTMAGVWSFLKTPLGVVAGIYGFMVVFWGTAIVVFLLKIINFHDADKQGFWIEVSSQVVNGLFTVTGVGLIPFRVLDTFRMSKIISYKRKTRERRAEAGLPPLLDVDDLPDEKYDPKYVHVLSEKQQADLRRQQEKFSYSQTWYRPHGTETHRAFPINIALLICCLNDLNSVFQIILCGTMWGMDRFHRPAWSTGVLIPLGFLSGIGAGGATWWGAKKTRRTEKVEELLRQALALDPVTDQAEHADQYFSSSRAGSPTDVSDVGGSTGKMPAIEEHMVVPPPSAIQ